MKWFKHESQARNDERIARLEDKAGLEGYGFYFKLLEIVASNMDSSSKCEMTYSLSRWGRQANISTKKVVFLLQCCHDVGLIIAQRVGDDMVVNIPNLLKYRDNHTKNLQVTSKQELDKELELEVDKELEKENTKEPKAKVAKTSFLLPDWINQTHWDAWHKHPKRKNLSAEQKQLAVIQLTEWRDAGIDYALSLKNSATNNWQGLFEPSNTPQSKPTKQSRMDISNIDYKAGVNADGSF